MIANIRREYSGSVENLIRESQAREEEMAVLAEAAKLQAISPGSVRAQLAMMRVIQAGKSSSDVPTLDAQAIEKAKAEEEALSSIRIQENSRTFRAEGDNFVFEVQTSPLMRDAFSAESRVPPIYARGTKFLGYQMGDKTVRLPIDIQTNADGSTALNIGGTVVGANGSLIGTTLTLTDRDIFYTVGGRKVYIRKWPCIQSLFHHDHG